MQTKINLNYPSRMLAIYADQFIEALRNNPRSAHAESWLRAVRMFDQEIARRARIHKLRLAVFEYSPFDELKLPIRVRRAMRGGLFTERDRSIWHGSLWWLAVLTTRVQPDSNNSTLFPPIA